MFENLSKRLSETVDRLRGRGRLSEENIREALREVRIALLEADVALTVVQALIERVKARAIGHEVLQSLTPGQTLIKIVHDELVKVMGTRNEELSLNCPAPAVVLMAGLQGSGKTTTTGKLARLLMERRKKRVMVVSCDVYRPAAIKQLETVAGQVGALFFASTPEQKPLDIARAALDGARRQMADVLIVDTAGRLAIDEAMMAEVAELNRALNPIETLFVVDSMTGQDAANTAKAFAEALPLTGVILTKTDGDARGGAALSVRYITGRPIKFLGAGEKLDALEPFHPDRVASRILGMGDVLSLIEDVTRKTDQDTMEKLAKKVVAGKKFDLEDMRDQLTQMQTMGGIGSLMEKLPMMPKVGDTAAVGAMGDKEMRKMVAIINSMTPRERRFPDLLNGSRKARIAKGSGTQPSDVNKLLKQYMTMEKMMKKVSSGGIKGLLRALRGGAMGGMGPGPGFGMPGRGMPPKR
jgi:signal recognition particle subunit SRP54